MVNPTKQQQQQQNNNNKHLGGAIVTVTNWKEKNKEKGLLQFFTHLSQACGSVVLSLLPWHWFHYRIHQNNPQELSTAQTNSLYNKFGAR